MKRRKPIKPDERIDVVLSARDRQLILDRCFLDPDIESRLRRARPVGTKLVVPLTLNDIDELAGSVAAEANHCEQPSIRRALDALYDRLSTLKEEYADGRAGAG